MQLKSSFLKKALFVVNYLAFYLIWIECLYAAVHGFSFFAACTVAAYLFVHLFFVSERPRAELILIGGILALGTFNDILLSFFGILKYVDASFVGASWWMAGIWGSFGSTYWHAFSWLESRKMLAAILGAIAVPFCYLWGAEVNVLTFLVNKTVALSVIGVLWAFLLPLTFAMSSAIKKFGC